MNDRSLLPAAVVVAIGIVLGAWLWTRDPAATSQPPVAGAEPGAKAPGAESAPEPKGPHGGRLFAQGEFALEVTIYEAGVPPQFRLYLYDAGKPIDPAAASVTLTLQRLGTPPQRFRFTNEGNYLRGDQVVGEPHSFDVAIAAQYRGQSYRWTFSQVEARIAMTDAAMKTAGIELATAGPARISSTVQLPGEIKLNADRVVQVVPRVAGVIAAAPVSVGQQVKRGDTLALVDSPMLADLRSQLFAASEEVDLTRATHEREKRLWEEKISAGQDYLQAQQAFRKAQIGAEALRQRLRALGVDTGDAPGNLARYSIRAPINGTVIERRVTLGESVGDNVQAFTVADLSTVWAEVNVQAKDLAIVKTGQPAEVKATSLDQSATGTVSYIGSLVGEQTRTAIARIVLRNPDGRWRPGLFVTVGVVADTVQVPVAVSVDAVQTLRDWSVAFGRYGNAFEARPLELGRSDGRMVEVLSGLAAGDQYAAKNSFAVKAELGKSGATHDH